MFSVLKWIKERDRQFKKIKHNKHLKNASLTQRNIR